MTPPKVALMCPAKRSNAADVSTKLKMSVSNTGNFLFQEALCRQLRFDLPIGHWDQLMPDIGTLVLAMANFIRPTADFAVAADAIERSKVEKVVLIGGGAQSHTYEEDLLIPAGTLRLLKIISERSTTIGVRGYYTAELLSKHGIRNVEVIGCPSIFWHMVPEFVEPQRIAPLDAARMVIHSTPSGYYRDRNAALYSFGARYNADYVIQNEEHILPLLERGRPLDECKQKKVQFFTTYYNYGDVPAQSLQDWLQAHVKIFFDIDEWRDYLATRSLAIGARFHGNVTAMLAGTPSLTLVFDSRTRELCEYTGLPYMHFDDFDPDRHPENYYQMANYGEFSAGFPRKYARFHAFLEANGLAHNLAAPSAARPSRPEAGSIKPPAPTLPSLMAPLPFTDRVKLHTISEHQDSIADSRSTLSVVHGIVNRMREFRSPKDRERAQRTAPNAYTLTPPAIWRSGEGSAIPDAGKAAHMSAIPTIENEDANCKSDAAAIEKNGRKFPTLSKYLLTADVQTFNPDARVCIVTNELAEFHQNGGIGTACSGLIESLSKVCRVHVLYTSQLDLQSASTRTGIQALRQRNIEICLLQEILPKAWMSSPRYISYGCFWYLRNQEFSVIHFNDYLGNGFYCTQARKCGAAFEKSVIITTVHGPTAWAMTIDERPLSSLIVQETCFLEMRSLEMSDVVMGVSNHLLEWLHAQRVVLPRHTYVHKNILPQTLDLKGPGGLQRGELSEIVFFARQDVRKGFNIFLDAVRKLSPQASHLKVTFLGKFSRIAGEHSGSVALDELRNVPNLIDFRHDYGRERAINHLLRKGILAVIPSTDENSPCTVVECITAKIPFIATAVGGIPELVSPQFHDAALFEPNATSLVTKIRDILENGCSTVDLGFDPAAIESEMLTGFASLHKKIGKERQEIKTKVADSHPMVSICITHFNRRVMLAKLLKEIEKQTYPNFEVVVVDDGSTKQEDAAFVESLKSATYRYPLKVVRIPNSYLGAARNASVRHARGEYVKFQDDDNIPLPRELEYFVRAAITGGADIVTSMSRFFREDSELAVDAELTDLEYLPLGASLPLSLFRNEYGDANALVRKRVFVEIGGFTELYGVGCEDYEFFLKAESLGYKFLFVPEPLFNYRVSGGSMLRSTSVYQGHKRARSGLQVAQSRWLDKLIDFAQETQLERDINDQAWHRAGTRPFGELHQQMMENDPGNRENLDRFLELAARYERLEDMVHLVLRRSPLAESLKWLEHSAANFDRTVKSGRQFLKQRAMIIDFRQFAGIELLEPDHDLLKFDLWKTEEAGLMVHPLSRCLTKVLIPRAIPAGTRKVTIPFTHRNSKGGPVKMSFQVAKFAKNIAASEWVEVRYGNDIDAVVELEQAASQPYNLIVTSTIDGSADFAWSFAKHIVVEGVFSAAA